eukprot:87407-Amphidinium_carterae.2
MAAVRPDIQFAVKELSRKLSAPMSKDESAAKHLIWYLRGTQNLVFLIAPSAWRSSQCIELHADCDSDWAGCPVSRKSTTGVICQLWEAELYELTSAANNLIHLQSVVKLVDGIKLHVHTDSASGKAMRLTVHKIGTQNNSVDILTKFMPQSTLSKHFSKVGLAEIGIDEVSIQHLRTELKISATSSSSTADVDVRTPKSETPERSQQTQKCCKCEVIERLRQCQLRSVSARHAQGTEIGLQEMQ